MKIIVKYVYKYTSKNVNKIFIYMQMFN